MSLLASSSKCIIMLPSSTQDKEEPKSKSDCMQILNPMQPVEGGLFTQAPPMATTWSTCFIHLVVTPARPHPVQVGKQLDSMVLNGLTQQDTPALSA